MIANNIIEAQMAQIRKDMQKPLVDAILFIFEKWKLPVVTPAVSV